MHIEQEKVWVASDAYNFGPMVFNISLLEVFIQLELISPTRSIDIAQWILIINTYCWEDMSRTFLGEGSIRQLR
jgi:hypothetical protein